MLCRKDKNKTRGIAAAPDDHFARTILITCPGKSGFEIDEIFEIGSFVAEMHNSLVLMAPLIPSVTGVNCKAAEIGRIQDRGNRSVFPTIRAR